MIAGERSGGQGARISVAGRSLINFASNDYLGLADHPRLREAAIDAIRRHGAGSGAARALSGTTQDHLALEDELARFNGTEAAILFGSGFAANAGAIPALVGKDDVVFSDALNHGSIIDGCRLSGARLIVYRHCDMNDLAAHLSAARGRGRALIVTDSVFSMDGDIAPLDEIAAIATAHDAMVLVDEAHGGGVYGANGRGVAEAQGAEATLKVGTLGKALGSTGGYVAGSAAHIALLRRTARTYLLSTAPPPAVVAAARAGLALMTAEPERRARLWSNAARLKSALIAAGVDTMASAGPIIPVIIGDAELAQRIALELLDADILAPAITAPLVAHTAARIRLIVGSEHLLADLDRVATILARRQ